MHHFFHRGRRHAEGVESSFFFGRQRGGGHGFGPFAGGFMGGMGLGGHGFRSGRKLGSGELQIVLLALLATQPSHGYELIKALDERSGGFYSPSPGMIYPALTWLEEVGYASVAAEGTKKLYSITDTGREYLKDNQDAADAMLGQLEHIGRKMGRVREIFGGSDEDGAAGESAEIEAARRALKQALRDKRGAPADEQSRIAAIMKNAADQIRGKG